MEKISKPGLYLNIPDTTYHGDLCTEPAISSTGIRTLVKGCPARFWAYAPFNPNRVTEPPKSSPALDFGKAAHDLLLYGKEHFFEGYLLAPESVTDRRVKDGREWLAEAARQDKALLMHKEWSVIAQMVETVQETRGTAKLLDYGYAEMSGVWEDREFGVWCKVRPDYLPADETIVVDYKTAESADPDDWRKSMFNYGYFVQAAFYLRGLRALGRNALKFKFIVQEKRPPYLVQVVDLDQGAVEWGNMFVRRGLFLFAECLQRGEWPGFTNGPISLGFNQYQLSVLQRDYAEGYFTVPEITDAQRAEMLAAGVSPEGSRA